MRLPLEKPAAFLDVEPGLPRPLGLATAPEEELPALAQDAALVRADALNVAVTKLSIYTNEPVSHTVAVV